MKSWTFLLTTFYLCYGRCDQWFRAEATTDNAVCDSADHNHVNAGAAGQLIIEHDHGKHGASPTPVPEPAHEQIFPLVSVVVCIDAILWFLSVTGVLFSLSLARGISNPVRIQ